MKEALLINGGNPLLGEIKVDGSKNSILPILAATVLCDGEIMLDNAADILDVKCMRNILQSLGIKTQKQKGKLYVDTRSVQNFKITHDKTQKLRASIFVLGALLGRFRSAVVAYPGGCKIGARPIDLHLKSFRSLGVKIIERHGYIYCYGENLRAGQVVLDFPSVGATESLMMCATLLDGQTKIVNAAKEPEIVELQNFLNVMGAKVCGAGTDVILIEGVKKLFGGKFKIMPDRIVAGTYLLAGAICGGDVMVDGANYFHNESLISYLRQTACKIDLYDDKIRLRANTRLSSIENIQTRPYPLFPTDLQPQMMVLQSVSDGVSIIEENMFENRFALVGELKKMGSDIVVKEQTALVRGVEKLYGADVFASDLRAGAALVLAGLKADGYTTVHNIDLIDRGYENIEEKLKLLGADIKRIKDE